MSLLSSSRFSQTVSQRDALRESPSAGTVEAESAIPFVSATGWKLSGRTSPRRQRAGSADFSHQGNPSDFYRLTHRGSSHPYRIGIVHWEVTVFLRVDFLQFQN